MTFPAPQLACGGAPGVINPAYERLTYVGAASVEALVGEFGTPALALLIAPIIAGTTYDLLHICSSPDPGDPGLTAQDIANALDFSNFIDSPAAQAKVIQWFTHMMWPTWCHCADGSIPGASVSAPLPPASTNPGLPSAPTGSSCWNTQGSSNRFDANINPYDYRQLLWTDSTPHTDPQDQRREIIPGMQSVTASQQLIGGSGSITATAVSLSYQDASGIDISTGLSADVAPNQLATLTLAAPANAVYVTVHFVIRPGTIPAPSWTGTFQASVQVTCAGQGPAVPVTPCCPPDPLITGLLQQILGELDILLARKSGGLTGYTKHTVHSGATGSASIGVSGLAGVLVDITAQPPTKVQAGNPPYVWDMGWMSIQTGDGMIEERRLTRTHQVWTPTLMPLATTFGYYLNPGVVANITELLPA